MEKNRNKLQKIGITAIIVAAALTTVIAILQPSSVIANPEGLPEKVKIIDMTIEMNPSAFTPSDLPVPLVKASKGQTIPIPMILKSETGRALQTSLRITFGALNEEPVLPPGVHASFTPTSVELPARGVSPANLVLRIDNDAPDGKYDISIIADAQDTNYATGFTLIVGQGAEYYIGPNGPIIPPQVRAQ